MNFACEEIQINTLHKTRNIRSLATVTPGVPNHGEFPPKEFPGFRGTGTAEWQTQTIGLLIF